VAVLDSTYTKLWKRVAAVTRIILRNATIKDLEPGKWVRIGDWYGAEKARELIVESIDRAKRSDQRAS